MNLFFTMAGKYSRFRLFGNKIPKYLYPLGSENVLSKVIKVIVKKIEFNKIIFIANNNDQLFDPILKTAIKKIKSSNSSLIYIDDTSSQVETALAGLEHLTKKEKDQPICFANVDTLIANRKVFFSRLKLCKPKEAIIDVFLGKSTNYSFIRPKDNQTVSEVVNNKVISEFACSGLYGFGSFNEMAKRAIKLITKIKSVSFADLYNEYINNSNKVFYKANTKKNDTIVLGTPEEYILNLHKFKE